MFINVDEKQNKQVEQLLDEGIINFELNQNIKIPYIQNKPYNKKVIEKNNYKINNNKIYNNNNHSNYNYFNNKNYLYKEISINHFHSFNKTIIILFQKMIKIIILIIIITLLIILMMIKMKNILFIMEKVLV